ncbi:terminase [Brevibacterium gallinarum]|uniref:Terminase n=1 Tax=Brevibacterium gallinarum TaxID=2762220 RepID=A0ABR8WQV8_9MICO|nr:terminase [Brevibacterium gallinarum]MBD8019380.1 terminase [Brevibacterium gallinarum]
MRLGLEAPRVYTPPLRELTPETSLGYDVIEFARDILEVELFPWQKWLLIHMLELRTDGTLRFATVVVLVARQNGKSTLSQVLALWFMMRWGWPLILGTAQDLDLAEEVWEGAVELLEEDDELKELVGQVFRVNGKKSLKLVNGSRYKVKAANRKAGRGLSGNLILLDELREHQSWDAWGAITKTTMAQTLSLVLALSNAGDVTSIVLRYLRLMAHKAIGDPDGICRDAEIQGPAQVDVDELLEEDDDVDLDVEDFAQDEDTLGLFEWSAKPDCDVRDRAGWAQANPSMNHPNGIPERNIASACRTDPEWVFRTEVLCQWSDGTLEGPFPPGSWEKGLNETVEDEDGNVQIAPGNSIVGPVRACIDMSGDRSMTYIAFAGYREDGQPQVEIVAKRRGIDWVKPWMMDDKRRDRIDEVTGQKNGAPISDTIKALADDPDFTIPVVEWAGGDLMAAHGITSDAVRDEIVRHNPQPVLDIAAATAVLKQLQDGFVINRTKSPVDASPLVAFEGALWLLLRHRLEPKPPPPPPKALAEALPYDIDDFVTDDLGSIGF